MLIELPEIAVRTLSARTDEEMYIETQRLAASLGTNPSTIIRLAIANLLGRAKKTHPKRTGELLDE